MRHTLPIAPQFYVTAPQPCPYLEGRMERKLFTALQGDNATKLNDSLSKQGFRRSQNVLYRPSCAECAACMSARIRVADFAPSKSQKRVAKRNAYLNRRATSPWATEAQYDLFRTYLDSRHATGGMADMDMFEFAAMVEETPIRSRLIEYTNAHIDDLRAASDTPPFRFHLSKTTQKATRAKQKGAAMIAAPFPILLDLCLVQQVRHNRDHRREGRKQRKPVHSLSNERRNCWI